MSGEGRSSGGRTHRSRSIGRSRSIDVDGIVADPVAVRNQAYDAADVAADVADIAERKTVMDVPPDDSIFTEGDDLEIISIVSLKVTLRSRRRAVEARLQLRRDLYSNKQALI